jgi:PAS domain S-box-containing protein
MSLRPDTSLSRLFRNAPEVMLGAVLDQSPDCIKILSSDGTLDYMNKNGQCAMEIDDFSSVAGLPWVSLWPSESRAAIESALEQAASGRPAHLQLECPTAKGNPRWWNLSVTSFTTESGQKGFISISRDVTDAVRAQHNADAVAAEMRHRLGNAYHIVGSLLSSFARGDPEKESFAGEMITRLNALAAAQSMRADEGEYDLRSMIEALVLPYETPAAPIRLDALPDCSLQREEVSALSMVFGELCVNSIKHGALGAGGGVAITGACSAIEIDLVWSERSNKPVREHERSGGQGLRIMQRVLAARQGSIDYTWHADGLDAKLSWKRSA